MIKRLKTKISSGLRDCGKFGCNQYPGNTIFLRAAERQVFFGYYDVCPFDAAGKKILATRTLAGNESPHNSHPSLEIGYFDLDEKELSFHVLGESRSWNWQQGCRLQWLDDKKFIYNDFDGQKYISKVQDISGDILKTYDAPIYAVASGGEYALTLDFYTLHQCRPGYGYNNQKTDQFHRETAVYKLDLATATTSPMIPFDAVRKAVRASAGFDAEYINHLSVSPDGQRFIFFYITLNGGKRKTHLISADKDGKDLRYVMPGYSPSHYCWKNDHELLVTAQTPDKNMVYGMVSIEAGHCCLLDHGRLKRDGHPSFIGGDIFITDTYPSRLGFQSLFTMDEKGASKDVAKFYLPRKFSGELRCDLHPRLSPDRKSVCVDVVIDERRCMAVIPLRGYYS